MISPNRSSSFLTRTFCWFQWESLYFQITVVPLLLLWLRSHIYSIFFSFFLSGFPCNQKKNASSFWCLYLPMVLCCLFSPFKWSVYTEYQMTPLTALWCQIKGDFSPTSCNQRSNSHTHLKHCGGEEGAAVWTLFSSSLFLWAQLYLWTLTSLWL